MQHIKHYVLTVLVALAGILSASAYELGLDVAEVTLLRGETLSLNVSVIQADAEPPQLTWTSSDMGIASVDSEGDVVAISQGSATITVQSADNSASASCEVTVMNDDSFDVEYEGNTFRFKILSILNNRTCELSQGVSVSDDVVVPSTVEYNGEEYKVTSLGHDSFVSNMAIQSIVIPDGVKAIGVRSFYDCHSLSSVVLGKDMELIEDCAFAWNFALKHIVSYAEIPPVCGQDASFHQNFETAQVLVPASSLNAYKEAFMWNKFTNIIGEVQVSELNFNASEFSMLKGETGKIAVSCVPVDVDTRKLIWSTSDNDIVEIDAEGNIAAKNPGTATITVSASFGQATASCEVTVLESLHFEVDGIYYNAVSLLDSTCEVTYRDGNYNSYFDDVVIPSTVTYSDITFNVVRIGDYALHNCSGLKSVKIPNSVSSIGEGAFGNCESLNELIVLNPTPPTVGWGAFDGVPKAECVLKVPAESLSAYQEAYPWNTFGNIKKVFVTNKNSLTRVSDKR